MNLRCPLCREDVEVRYVGELNVIAVNGAEYYGAGAPTYRCAPRGHLFAQDDHAVA